MTRHCGVLSHHMQECDECGGRGWFKCRWEGWEGREDCGYCGGEGYTRWESWYQGDTGKCDSCGEEGGISHMYDSGDSVGGVEWVCFRCYVRQHKAACGCHLWANYEV